MELKTMILVPVIAACTVFAFLGCRNETLDPAEVTGIEIVWIPNPRLREARMEISLEPKVREIFVSKLNLSREIDAVWADAPALYEGRYEITVAKKSGGGDRYELRGDGVLHLPARQKYLQNKDLHLFVYQLLFLEFAKRKIKIQ